MPKGQKSYVTGGGSESVVCPCGYVSSGRNEKDTKTQIRLHNRFCNVTELTTDDKKKNLEDRIAYEKKISKINNYKNELYLHKDEDDSNSSMLRMLYADNLEPNKIEPKNPKKKEPKKIEPKKIEQGFSIEQLLRKLCDDAPIRMYAFDEDDSNSSIIRMIYADNIEPKKIEPKKIEPIEHTEYVEETGETFYGIWAKK